jgi:hypothetical protein
MYRPIMLVRTASVYRSDPILSTSLYTTWHNNSFRQAKQEPSSCLYNNSTRKQVTETGDYKMANGMLAILL